MIKKKVLVHGTANSLREFFASRFNREYDPIAILSDDVAVATGGGGDLIAPSKLPKGFYKLVDGIVLTDSHNTNVQVNYFLKLGIAPRKIILWNAAGKIEPLQFKQADGTPVVCIEGLEFRIRNNNDIRFVNQVYGWLQQQRRFYAMNPSDYPAVVANVYKAIHGKPLDWNNLQTWTEKMQWIKLYDSTPLKTRLADKYLVRFWIAEQIGEEYLIPLLGVWDDFDDIDFDSLPNEFVLKCNHGSGMNIIVRDKATFDKQNARKMIDAWQILDYGTLSYELHYNNIHKRIIAEMFMKDSNSADLIDYKFWCFNGTPAYCLFYSDRSTDCRLDYFDLDWHHMNFESSDHPNSDHPERIRKPKNFTLMKNLAEKLCKGFAHVRVDFYEIEGKVYFGEMTFTPAAANITWKPADTDEYLGNLMTLPQHPAQI